MKDTNAKQKIFERRNFYCLKDASSIYFLILIFGLGISLVYAFVFSQIMTNIDPNFKLEEVEGSPVYLTNYFLSAILIQAVFLLVYFFYHKIEGVTFKASNVKKPNVCESFVWIGLGMVCLLGFMCLIEGCFGHMFSALKIDIADFKMGNFGIYFACLIFMGLVPAVVEELIFRGVIFQGIRGRFSLWASVLLCGLLFALMHQNIVQFIYPFVLGCVLCLIMEKTNNLAYCMMFHFANNFATLTVGYIMECCNFSFQNLPITWWFVLISILCAVVAICIIILALKFVKSKKVEQERVGEEPTKRLACLGKIPISILLSVIVLVVIIVINACI